MALLTANFDGGSCRLNKLQEGPATASLGSLSSTTSGPSVRDAESLLQPSPLQARPDDKVCGLVLSFGPKETT